MSTPRPTPAQFAILQLIWEGHTHKYIANHLDLNVNTVGKHVRDMYLQYAGKGVDTPVKLIRLALEETWITYTPRRSTRPETGLNIATVSESPSSRK